MKGVYYFKYVYPIPFILKMRTQFKISINIVKPNYEREKYPSQKLPKKEAKRINICYT